MLVQLRDTGLLSRLHTFSIVNAAGKAAFRTAVGSLKQYEDTAVRVAQSPGLREVLHRKLAEANVPNAGAGSSDAVLFRPDLLVSDLERTLRAAAEAKRDAEDDARRSRETALGGRTPSRKWRHVIAST